MTVRSFLAALALVPVLCAPAIVPASAQDTERFSGDVARTIQAACHSFIVDALPDAVAWLREDIYQNSPFCRSLDAAGDMEAFGETVQEAYNRLGPDDPRLDLAGRVDRYLAITIECQSEYMCMETRLKFLGSDNPVDQAAYDTVSAYCDGRYGCIQAYFSRWPAPLPAPKALSEIAMARFEKEVGPPGQADMPPAQQVASAPEMSSEQPPAVDPVQPISAAPVSPAAPEEPVASPTPAAPAELEAPPTGEISKRIDTLNASLQSNCRCSLAGAPCFDNPYGPVRTHIQQVEEQRLRYCKAWDDLSRGGIAPSDQTQATADQLSQLLKSVTDADDRGEQIIQIAMEDFEIIKYRVRNNLPFKPMPERDKMVEQLAADPSPPPTQTEQTASSTGTDGTAQSDEPEFIMGQRQGWEQAGAFCSSIGRRLPTVAEARDLRTKIPDEDWYFGLWTSEAHYVDAYVKRYKTMRPNGRTEGEDRSWEARVACVQ